MKSAFLFTAPIVLSVLFTCGVMTGCITPGVTHQGYAAIQFLPVLPGEKVFHLDDDNKAMALSEGIPASYLAVKDSRGWVLTRANEIMAADMLTAKINPGLSYSTNAAGMK